MAATKIRHSLERLCALKNNVDEGVVGQIKKDIIGLWGLLEVIVEIIDEICLLYHVSQKKSAPV